MATAVDERAAALASELRIETEEVVARSVRARINALALRGWESHHVPMTGQWLSYCREVEDKLSQQLKSETSQMVRLVSSP